MISSFKAAQTLATTMPVKIERSSFAKCVRQWKKGKSQKLAILTKSGANKFTAEEIDGGQVKWTDVILPLVQAHTKINCLKAQDCRSTKSKAILTLACKVHGQMYLQLEADLAKLEELPADTEAEEIIEWTIARPKKFCNCCKL